MKKIIIIAAITVSSGLTAYCLNTKQAKPAVTSTLKINAADFAAKTINGSNSGLASAD